MPTSVGCKVSSVHIYRVRIIDAYISWQIHAFNSMNGDLLCSKVFKTLDCFNYHVICSLCVILNYIYSFHNVCCF